MLKWITVIAITVIAIVLVQPAAYAGVIEDCVQDQDNARRIRACTERLHQFPRDATAYFNRGSAYLATGELERAIADTSRVIDIDSGYAAAYFKRAAAYEGREQYDRAIADYGKAIEINPRFAQAYHARAQLYLKTAQPTLALRDAERAVDLVPYEADVIETRAHVFEALGRTQDAVADYRKVLAADPSAKSAIDGLRRLRASPSDAVALPR